MSYSLKELAEIIKGKVYGDEKIKINNLSTLDSAKDGEISFLANPKYVGVFKKTKASAVVITKEALEICPTNSIVVENPYLCFAKLAELFDKLPKEKAGVHRKAIVKRSAKIHKSATVCAGAVIGDLVEIQEGAVIGANVVISNFVTIKKNVAIKPNVTIYHDVIIDENTIIHAGSVIGSDGFGNVKDEQGNWKKIPQLGGVRIGKNVEIGANTTIDRGALDHTIIEDGVKIDNQVQIAHNVIIGENTAIAAQSGVAGSAKIGKNCLFGGQSGVGGHISITDNVMVAGDTSVGNNIEKPGVFGGYFWAQPNNSWKKNIVRFNKLDELNKRVRKIEKELKN